MAEGKEVGIGLQDCHLTVGSLIKCRYQGGDVSGQIQAFHPQSRLLIIKSPASSGSASQSDVTIVNVDCIENLSINGVGPVEELKQIDFAKLEKRKARAVDQKKSKIRALSSKVTPEGRKLCLTLMKTIPEVSWDGEKLIVFNDVIITPPYKTENVTGEQEAAVVLVKKVVEKHWQSLGSQ